MKILNYGSLNIDFVYSVPHFVVGGETLAASERRVFPGGKGLNQSIALAKAGADVYHAGAVGKDGVWLIDLLSQNGVNTKFLQIREDVPTGHAVIQVDESGQNCIIIDGGANQSQTDGEVKKTLSNFEAGDMLLLQNEINGLHKIIQMAKNRNITVVLNPSPIDETLLHMPLNMVDIIILNEVEAEAICGETDCEKQLNALKSKFPDTEIVLTQGEKGVACETNKNKKYSHGIYKVKAADTTAAGDTFTGFYMAAKINGLPTEEALKRASAASAITVSRKGASVSIPTNDEVDEFLRNRE